MFTMKLERNLTTLALAGACAGSLAFTGEAEAHGADGDLFFYPQGGELIVGRYDFDGLTGVVLETETEPVIIAEFSNNWEGTGSPGTDEPGLATDASSPFDPDGNNFPFPASTPLIATANVLPVLGVDLAYWDATGPVSFTPSTDNSIIVETPFGSSPVPELEFDGDAIAPSGQLAAWQSSGAGTAHDHFEFLSAEDDASTLPGIYLLSLTFDAGGVSSEPLYFLLGYNDGSVLEADFDEALELAEGYVESVIVPEPASALLLAAAGGLALIRRR